MMRDLTIIDINHNPCYASATNTPFHYNLPLLGHTDLRLADGDLLGLRVHAELRRPRRSVRHDRDGGRHASQPQHHPLHPVLCMHRSRHTHIRQHVPLQRHTHLRELSPLVPISIPRVMEHASTRPTLSIRNDTQRKGVARHLRSRAPQPRLQRHHRTRALQHRNEVQRCVQRNRLPSLHHLLVVDAVPRAPREIHTR